MKAPYRAIVSAIAARIKVRITWRVFIVLCSPVFWGLGKFWGWVCCVFLQGGVSGRVFFQGSSYNSLMDGLSNPTYKHSLT